MINKHYMWSQKHVHEPIHTLNILNHMPHMKIKSSSGKPKEMQRYLTKSRSTRVSIATINPGITQTWPSLTGTHSLTRHATFLRGIQHKLRTPFDSITPKLQMLNPSATLPFFWTLIFHWRQRFTVGPEDHGKEKVHGRAGDCANQEEGEKRESTEIWIVLATTHFPECREN